METTVGYVVMVSTAVSTLAERYQEIVCDKIFHITIEFLYYCR
jgi:hypothetical protein